MELKKEFYWSVTEDGPSYFNTGFATEAEAVAEACSILLPNTKYWVYLGEDIHLDNKIFDAEKIINEFSIKNCDLHTVEGSLVDVKASVEAKSELENDLAAAFYTWRVRNSFGRSGMIDTSTKKKMKTPSRFWDNFRFGNFMLTSYLYSIVGITSLFSAYIGFHALKFIFGF